MQALHAAARNSAKSKQGSATFQKKLQHIMELSVMPKRETNDFHPMALTAGITANPSILSHKDAMKADNKENFLLAMEAEIDWMVSTG
eukprot:15126008-Ditylum_brightwellii.AAC.1